MASAKLLALGGVGLLAAGALVYLVAFHDSDPGAEKPAPAPIEKPVEKAPPSNVEDPAAVAKPATGSDARKAEGGTVAAMLGGVEGLVRNPKGQPVPNAKIDLFKPIAAQLAMAQGRKTNAAPEIYSGKSDLDGRFQIKAPPSEGWTLIATHPEYARVEIKQVSTPGDSYASYMIDMRAGVRIYGRVTEEGNVNRPIQGAMVFLDPPPLAGAFNNSTEMPREVATDGSGAFKFENVAPGQHRMRIKAAGYGSRELGALAVADEETQRQDVFLKPGMSISGRVVDTQGAGVAKARVTATTGGISGSFGEELTNDLGEFVLRDLEDGRYYIRGEADGYGAGSAEGQPIAAGSVEIVVQLAARSAVQGIVREKASGNPVRQFSVTVKRALPNATFYPTEMGPLPFKSNDGSFTVQGLDATFEHILEVSAEGYASALSERFSVQVAQVTRGIEVMLTFGGTISGRVVDARDNKPVAGAVVKIKPNTWQDMSALPGFLGQLVEQVNQRSSERSATTDAEGGFTIKHVDEGISQVVVTHPQFVALMQKDVASVEAKTTDVGTLKLTTGAALKGVVYGADGAPAANAEVTARATAIIPGRGMVQRTVRTDAQGRYVFRGLPSGDYFVSSLHPPGPGAASNDVFGSMIVRQKTQKQIALSDGSEQEVDIYLPAK
ncbi:MAG: carboxypeptidase regulatory-like domain-containing protein [Planctomycetes bacterium]|nr:carboxypeptidase regulatory-like domain-containing protein [Planctomycetota bacterium]